MIVMMVVVVMMIRSENGKRSSDMVGFLDALLIKLMTVAGRRHTAHSLGIMHALWRGRWWSYYMSVVTRGYRSRRWWNVENLWGWRRGWCWSSLDNILVFVHIRGFRLFVVLASLDNFVDMLFFECTGDDEEVILFLIWVSELYNGLFPAQTLGQSGLALLAPVCSGKGDLLETRCGRATRRSCHALSTAAASPNPALALLA